MCSLNDNENDDSNLSTVGQEERNKKENKPTVAEKADKTIEKGKKIADAAKSKKGQAVIKFLAAYTEGGQSEYSENNNQNVCKNFPFLSFGRQNILHMFLENFEATC